MKTCLIIESSNLITNLGTCAPNTHTHTHAYAHAYAHAHAHGETASNSLLHGKLTNKNS